MSFSPSREYMFPRSPYTECKRKDTDVSCVRVCLSQCYVRRLHATEANPESVVLCKETWAGVLNTRSLLMVNKSVSLQDKYDQKKTVLKE